MQSKLAKILLGGATVWPVVYIFSFVIYVLTLVGAGPDAMFGGGEFAVIFLLHMMTILGSFGLIGYYIYHVFKKNPALDSTQKMVWALVLMNLNFFAMPVYWYLHIWKDQPAIAEEAELPAVDASAVADVAERFDEESERASSVEAIERQLDMGRDEVARADLDDFERRLSEVPEPVERS